MLSEHLPMVHVYSASHDVLLAGNTLLRSSQRIIPNGACFSPFLNVLKSRVSTTVPEEDVPQSSRLDLIAKNVSPDIQSSFSIS